MFYFEIDFIDFIEGFSFLLFRGFMYKFVLEFYKKFLSGFYKYGNCLI